MVSKWNLRCNIALACLAVITPSTCSAINVIRTTGYAASAKVHNGTLTDAYSAKYNQDFFLGVPFAQPPLGNLRLNLPQALNTSWTGPKEAVQYSALCVGYGGDDVGYDVSEDCLTLNVIRPAGVSKDAELPVAVWIHGGGNVMGGSGDRRYNLSFIVENSVAINQPIIGVSINYRLSGFGFMYNDAIASAGLANLGLLDQRLALHWIQENIAAFGGSPQKVTIWGESAGGVSVGAHILAYGGRDDRLFRAAIAQSGGPAYISRSTTRTARANSNSVTRATGCANVPDELACLRALPFDTLNQAMNITPSYSFGPVIDGTFLTTLPSTQLASGAFVRVPFIIGANTDEGTASSQSGINDDADFIALVRSHGVKCQNAEVIARVYPNIPAIGIPDTLVDPPTNTTIGTQYKRVAAFLGDLGQFGPRRAACEAWSNFDVPAYCYRFNVMPAGIPLMIGATHFQEVSFVMDNVNGDGYAINPFLDMPATYTQLAALMSRSWVSFIANLQPNAHGDRTVPGWPMYNISDGKGAQDMLFDANLSSLAVPERDTYRAEGIAFINELAATDFER